jgi:hypothetical protein
MIKIVIIYSLLIINFITAFDFLISTQNETQNERIIKCVENSFDIIINDKIVEYTNIRLNYEIRILNNQSSINNNKLEYAAKCLKSIIIKYNRQTVIFKSPSLGVKQIEIKFDLKLKSSIGIGNLDYLKQYSFELAYKQLNSLNEEVIINLNKERNFHVSTCFGRPGMPENLQCKLTRDDNVLCEWQRSQNVNSPDVCYYELLIDEYNGKNLIKYETNEKRFLFDGSKYKNFTFFLSAINDAKCYLTFYPIVKECKYERVSSKYYTVNIQIDNSVLSSSKAKESANIRMNVIDSIDQNRSANGDPNNHDEKITISSSTQSMSLYVNKNETNKNALNFFLLFLVFILIKIFILIF